MRVLVSAYACKPGWGSEPYLGHNWVKQIARFHDVVVLTDGRNRENIRGYPYGGNVRFEFVDCRVASDGHGIHFRNWRGKEWLGYYHFLLKSYVVARRLYREQAFDLCHLVTWQNFRWPFLLALLPCPSILGPVGGGDRCPVGFLRGSFYERVRTISIGLTKLDPLLRLTLHRTSLILAATRGTAAAIPEPFRIKVRVMAHGFDFREVPASFGARRARGEFVILAVGLLVTGKGLDLLVGALPRMREELGDSFRVVIYGDGPERQRLEAMAQHLGVVSRIEFRGWVPRHEVLLAYRDADVFCFPSFRESFGVALLEAMASGLPVVCLAHAAQGEIVTEECGIRIFPITQTQVIHDLASALINLAKDPSLREVLGVSARSRVEAVYDWDRRGEEMAKIYDSVVAARA